MRRLLIVCFALMIGMAPVFAQNNHGGDYNRPANKEIRDLRIKVVTKDMNLTEAQRKDFLPLYNKYSDELLVYRRKRNALKDNPATKEVIDQRLKIDQDILSVKTKYKSQFLNIISAAQLETMYKGEEDFRQLLLKRINSKGSK